MHTKLLVRPAPHYIPFTFLFFLCNCFVARAFKFPSLPSPNNDRMDEGKMSLKEKLAARKVRFCCGV